MKLVLIYPPFCTPTVPPYSVTYLKAFLKANSKIKIKCLDLNAKFHKKKFKELYKRLQKAKNKISSYSELLEEYSRTGRKVHCQNNIDIAKGRKPEFFNELIQLVLEEKPDVVGFSIVYNSQVFYAKKMIEELSKKGIKCVLGGPAAENARTKNTAFLKNEIELLKLLAKKEKFNVSNVLDFSDYSEEDYLSKEMIYPLRSSYGCSWKGCAFCIHHANLPYMEIEIEELKKTITKNKIKNLFLIDDNVPAKRLMTLAEAFKPLKIKWWCQTRPTKELVGKFKKLRESGLVAVSFGVESGNQKILDSMRKGTKVNDIEEVLSESCDSGIKNIIFVMFGFPGETKSSFRDTLEFLKRNKKSLDIVSASVFGLQKGSCVYENPEDFGVFDICQRETVLGPSIEYKVKRGIDEKTARKLKEKINKELKKLNKLPKIFCLFKEQSILF